MADENIDLKVKLKSSDDNELLEVNEAVAFESKLVKDMIEDAGKEMPIPLTNVSSKILAKVLEYSKYHLEKHAVPEDEVRKWDGEFIKVDQATLFDLILTAKYLNVSNLSDLMYYSNVSNVPDLMCQTVADMIKSKTPEEKEEAERRLTEVRLVFRGWTQLQLMKNSKENLCEKELCDVSLYKSHKIFLDRFAEFENKLSLYRTGYLLGDDQNSNFEAVLQILAAIEIKVEEVIKDARNFLARLLAAESESLPPVRFPSSLLQRVERAGFRSPWSNYIQYLQLICKHDDENAKRYDRFLVIGSDLKPLTNACYCLGETWKTHTFIGASLWCSGVRDFMVDGRAAKKEELNTDCAYNRNIDVWVDMTEQLTKVLCKADMITIEVAEKAEFLRPFMEFVTFGEAR